MRFRQTRLFQDIPTQSMFGRVDRLVRGNWFFETMSCEREWKNNLPNISCIPVGTYSLVPHNGTKYRDTMALVGETVSYLPMEGVPRSVCVFHKATRGRQLQGCIAWGETVTTEPFAADLTDFKLGKTLIAGALKAYHAGELVQLVIRNAEGFNP